MDVIGETELEGRGNRRECGGGIEGEYSANSHTLRFTKYVAFLKKINHTIYKL